MFGTGLPNRFINMAVPVNFFHLDRAFGTAFPIFGAGFGAAVSVCLVVAVLTALLIGVEEVAGNVGLEIMVAEDCPVTVAVCDGVLMA